MRKRRPGELESMVMEALRAAPPGEPPMLKEIARTVRSERRTVYQILQRLTERGMVRHVHVGPYRLMESS